MRLHILKKMQGPGNSRTVCSFNYNDYDNDLLHVHYYDDEAARTTKVLSKPHRSMLNKRYVS